MASKAHRFRATAAAVMSTLAGLALSTAFAVPSRAADSYVVPATDGYGITDCMHSGTACGRVIADSWCESHGHAHALAFGMVEDVTGAIQAGTKAEPVTLASTGDIVIRCGD